MKSFVNRVIARRSGDDLFRAESHCITTSLPFGDALSQVGISPAHFTDQDHDPETGLDHFLYRQYSPTQGRWMTPDPGGLGVVDPTNPQSWNRYAYVMNNPLRFTDLLGGWPSLSRFLRRLGWFIRHSQS